MQAVQRRYDSVFPMQYRKYMELIQPQGELDYNRIAPISDPLALDSPLLDLLNVKYVITEEPIDNPKYTLVYLAEVRIYRNETAMPRAFTLPLESTFPTDDFGAAVQKADPRRYAFVASKEWAPDSAPGKPADPAPVNDGDIRYSPNEVFITTAVNEPSWLVLADSYSPGWKAFVRLQGGGDADEKEVEITLVDGNFRGVQLPPGAWTVRFKYTPLAVKLGGILSLMAGMTLLFGLGVWAWRYFYQESAVDSTARRVAKNSLAPMALNLMNRAIDLIFAAFYLRVLGPGDVGKYAFAIVIFGWFEIVTNYGLNTLLTRDVSRDRGHANRYLINTTILRLLLGLVVIPGLALLLGTRQLLPNPLTADTLWAIALLVLAQAPATVSTGLTALFYVYEKAEYPAAVATITTILKVTIGAAVLILGWGFVGLGGTSILVNVITLAILAFLVWRLFLPSPRWELDWGLQRSALRESFSLMLNHLLATLFFKVVFPVMSRQAKEDRAALKRTYALAVKLLVAVALPVAVLTAFLAPLLVGLLGGQEFLPFGAVALAIMVWSIPFGWINSVTNYLLVALDQQRGLTRAFAISLIFNVVANLIFLPRYGYPAAAAITIASEIFEGAALYWYLRRSLGPIPWVGWLWRLWVSAAAMVGITLALWRVQPVLALAGGLAVYVLGVVGLRAFTVEEQSILAGILPSRVRERLHLKSVNS
ncbi:MAG: polysaccharide biosynthesis C-terminal domain-containing protein [Chloroflexi bacterium]|nr:polysaccharide biosynthesis C-terminal domain-containing protein [Chloroflexota bacterium]